MPGSAGACERGAPVGLLSRVAPIAVLGCVVSGLISSAFYALIPAWMQGEGIDQARIGLVIFVAILDGLAFPIPVGPSPISSSPPRPGQHGSRPSDHVARSYVPAAYLAFVLPAAVLLHGFMSTLYPLCFAHAHDRCQRIECSPSAAVSSWWRARLGRRAVIGAMIMAWLGLDGVFYLMRHSRHDPGARHDQILLGSGRTGPRRSRIRGS